jgi:heme/copper-type cytochrome/quinol oxidase subunit 3
VTTLVSPPTTISRRIVEDRGTWAMLMFIATEASLFVCLFFAYYYLGRFSPHWPPKPPEYTLALIMLALLLSSSVVLHAGERAEKRGSKGTARLLVLATIAMGVAFLGIQAVEYKHHLETLQPTSDAYGSIFYAITSFHAAHVVLGLLMLGYVLVLPEIGPGRKPPHRPLHNASLYWHFVDVIWVFIVGLLYLAPQVGR